jgi:hypothetical protein
MYHWRWFWRVYLLLALVTLIVYFTPSSAYGGPDDGPVEPGPAHYQFKSKNGTPIVCDYFVGDVGHVIHAQITFPGDLILNVDLEELYPRGAKVVISPTQARALYAIVEGELSHQYYNQHPIDPKTGKPVVYTIGRSSKRLEAINYAKSHPAPAPAPVPQPTPQRYYYPQESLRDKIDDLNDKIDDLQDTIDQLKQDKDDDN